MKRFFKNNRSSIILGVIITAALILSFVCGDDRSFQAAEISESNTLYTETYDKTFSQSVSRNVYTTENVLSKSEKAKKSDTQSNKNKAPEESFEIESEQSDNDCSYDSDTIAVGETEKEISQANPDTDVTDESTIQIDSECQENDSALSSEESIVTDTSESQHYCTLVINCSNALNYNKLDEDIRTLLPENGEILNEIDAPFLEGDTPFTLLQKICREKEIPLEYSLVPMSGGAYIEGIDNLYELDCGNLSGWMFSINGEFPSVSCSEITLCEGDIVAFLYTCDLGEDVGNHYRGD